MSGTAGIESHDARCRGSIIGFQVTGCESDCLFEISPKIGHEKKVQKTKKGLHGFNKPLRSSRFQQ